MGFFDGVLPALGSMMNDIAKRLGNKPRQPTGAGFNAEMPITPTLPQGGYHSISSQPATGPTTAQVFQPLVQRMAGQSMFSPANRSTMSANGQGLSTESSWRGMFAHGANDLTPAQLRASQGNNAVNQWVDPEHYGPNIPSSTGRAEGAAMASPEMFHISPESRGVLGLPPREPTLRDIVQSEQNVTPQNPFANSRAEGRTLSPAPAGSQGPASETSPMGSPSPGYKFGTTPNGASYMPPADMHPAASNPPAGMFGPSMMELKMGDFVRGGRNQVLKDEASKKRSVAVVQPDWGAAPMF